MDRSAIAADRGARLLEIEQKYSFSGRLERFCRGRLAILPVRIAYEGAGAALVALFSTWQLGAMAFLFCMAGEAVEFATIIWARQRCRIERSPEIAGKVVTVGSAAWAVGMVGGAAIFWSIGGFAFWFLSFVFLFSALVNAQLVGGLHPQSLLVKQIIILGAAAVMLGDAFVAGAQLRDVWVFGIGMSVMTLTLMGLFARLRLQNDRRHLAEEQLMRAQSALEETNLVLRQSQRTMRETARKAEGLAFESQAANRAKSQFVATVSREVRAAMRRILDAVIAVEASPRQDGLARTTQEVRETAGALIAVVSDLLDLSKVDVGQFQLQEQRVELVPFLSKTVEAHRDRAASKGLALETEWGVPSKTWVTLDQACAARVLNHLLDRAIAVSENGTIRCEVEATGPIIVVAITDSGPTIDRTRLGRMFDGPGGAADEGTGSALALALARKLSRLMGGDLSARSERSGGTTFFFSVSAKAGGGRQADDVARASVTDGFLLIGEGQEPDAVAKEMMNASSECNWAYECAARDPDVFLATDPPNLVIMELDRPADEYAKVVRNLRTRLDDKYDAYVPIVAVLPEETARGSAELLYAAGADDVSVGPLSGSQLAASAGQKGVAA